MLCARKLNSAKVLCAVAALLLAAGCEVDSAPQASDSYAARPTTAPARAAQVKPATAPSTPSASLKASEQLPAYRPLQVVSGPLRSVGSDSMDRIMQLWEGQFKSYHPDIVLRHEGRGSGTALPALMEGLSELGPMSRPTTSEEVASFNQRFNHPPTQVRVAVDALAVFVHPSNPIASKGLTFQQLDAIFSSTRKLGGDQDITTWGQLGLTGQWASAPINVCSRNKASGTYAFFREHVMKKGDFKTTNRELPGSQEVIDAVAGDPFAIGFSSVGYVTPQVAAVPLSDKAASFSPPTADAAYANRYPLARYLYVTVNHSAEQPLKAQTQEFLRFILSRDGQNLVVKEGLFPMTAALATEEVTRLGLKP